MYPNPVRRFNTLDELYEKESDFNMALNIVEQTGNFFGYIPFVSTLTGAMRIAAGKIQTIASLSLFCMFFVTLPLTIFNGENFAKHVKISLISKKHIPHGFANIFRGFFEIIPFVGNFLCLAYDVSNNRMSY
jgi:hypothetical protein